MKVLLHIGWHKTGTTSLQHFLFHNRAALRQRGRMHYPSSDLRAQHVVAWKLIGKRFAGFLKRIGADGDDPQTAIQRMAAEAQAQGAETLVLSSEVFSQTDQYDPARLRHLLRGHDVRVIAYVRRQDRYLEARYNQKVKQARLTEEFPVYCQRFIDSGMLDYHAYFRRWADLFGPDSLALRVYDRARLREGDVRRDFCDLIGLDAAGLDFASDDRNASLNFRALQFLKRFNVVPQDHESRRALVRILEELEVPPAHRHTSLFATAERRALLARFAESNRRFVHEFLRTEDPFQPAAAELAAEDQLDRSFSEQQFLEMLAAVLPRLYPAKSRRAPEASAA